MNIVYLLLFEIFDKDSNTIRSKRIIIRIFFNRNFQNWLFYIFLMMMKERKKETQNSYEEENFTEINKNNIFNKFQNNQQIYK